MENVKIIRKLPQSLEDVNNIYKSYDKVLTAFFVYVNKLSMDLDLVSYYNKNRFNSLDKISINEYVELFNKYLDDFNKLIFSEIGYGNFKKSYNSVKSISMSLLQYDTLKYLNPDIFEKNYQGKLIAIKSEYFNAIEKAAKKIFMLEKLCASTSKKIWNMDLTNPQEINLSKPYRIIVKKIFEDGWRIDNNKENIQKFSNDRIYQSASLISHKNHKKLFMDHISSKSALLIYEPDSSKIVCSSQTDAFSDEYINNKNPYAEADAYSNIQLMDIVNINGNEHKLFARGTEICTPIVLLKNFESVNEIVMKNPKIVGVLAPQKNCEEFAKKIAKQHNVQYYGILENFELEK